MDMEYLLGQMVPNMLVNGTRELNMEKVCIRRRQVKKSMASGITVKELDGLIHQRQTKFKNKNE